MSLVNLVQQFSWQLQENSQQQPQLVYRQPKVKWVIFTWPKNSQVEFSYTAFDGTVTTQWPYYGNDEPEADGRMPKMVQLTITEPEQATQYWYNFLPGRLFPRGDYRDIIPTDSF